MHCEIAIFVQLEPALRATLPEAFVVEQVKLAKESVDEYADDLITDVNEIASVLGVDE